ncbi:3-beta hydroxysteroid dehydrogenase/isomerase [Dillenia turbinata]|uniref:3-beta hydroxysteroid dehydrogenase/isomerase n=1 Tax=Dillenia turbinata TaxID=194707 RepID=A0AAN8W0H8_9MAGN
MPEKGRVCVTGAKLVIRKSEALQFKADLLDYDSLFAAIKGCDGVFNVAIPVPPTHVFELIQPAVNGTLSVLKACSDERIKRFIYVSTTGAVNLNPSWPKGRVKDENCWYDKDHCKAINNWYCLSKTEAESKSFEYAKESKLDVWKLCYGHTKNQKLREDTYRIDDRLGFLLIKTVLFLSPLFANLFACIGCFTKASDEEKVSSNKLQRLEWSYRPLEETLVDSIKSYTEACLLN